MKRFAEPDTDRDWSRIGDSEPYWGVLTDPMFEMAKLDPAGIAVFAESGMRDVAIFHRRLVSAFGAPAKFASALDFGCGVGRLLVPIAQRSQRAWGVDVAPGMRARAVSTVAQADLSHRVRVVSSIAEAAGEAGQFEWVNSFIVLQHIPPSRVPDLVSQLASATAPGGFVSLHLTTWTEPHLRPNWKGRIRLWLEGAIGRTGLPNPSRSIRMFDHDLAANLAILEDHGFENFILDPTNHGGHRGYIIYARRRPATASQGALGSLPQ